MMNMQENFTIFCKIYVDIDGRLYNERLFKIRKKDRG